MHNPNCCGDHCRAAAGLVRVYPLGGGGNLILCEACWAAENRYRRDRGRETGAPENWPGLDWEQAEVYPTEWIAQNEQKDDIELDSYPYRHVADDEEV